MDNRNVDGRYDAMCSRLNQSKVMLHRDNRTAPRRRHLAGIRSPRSCKYIQLYIDAFNYYNKVLPFIPQGQTTSFRKTKRETGDDQNLEGMTTRSFLKNGNVNALKRAHIHARRATTNRLEPRPLTLAPDS